MSRPEQTAGLESLSEPEITQEQQAQITDAVSAHILPITNRVPLYATDPNQGIYWTGLKTHQGVMLAAITRIMHEGKRYTEYAVSLGRADDNTDAIREQELAIIVDDEAKAAWPRSHDKTLQEDDIKPSVQRVSPLQQYPQLANSVIAALEKENRQGTYSAERKNKQLELQKRFVGYNKLREAGFTGHGATALRGRWALTLLQSYDHSEDLYVPDEDYFEISESQIRSLGAQAEACAQASRPGQTAPSSFQAYDAGTMRAVSVASESYPDGRIRLTVRIEHTLAKTETFMIAPSFKYGQLATYVTANFSNELFETGSPLNIDNWAAQKTNTMHPPGTIPMTRAHYKYLTEVLGRLRFDD